MKETILLFLLSYTMSLSLCDSDLLMFNYHQLRVGPLHTSISWNYISQRCIAVKFLLKGFMLSQVIYNQPVTPRIEILSSEPTFSLPTTAILQETLYFNISVIDSDGNDCIESEYYYFLNGLFENGSHIECLDSSSTQVCVDVPDTGNEHPHLVWPKSIQSQNGYCFCSVIAGFFSGCSSQCTSIYQFSFDTSTNSVCLTINGDTIDDNNPLKVYFILDNDYCINSRCIISSFVAERIIRSQESCRGSVLNLSQPHILTFHHHNSSITSNEHSTLNLNVSYERGTSHQQAAWRHNGFAVSTMMNPRIQVAVDGGLTITDVEVTDAGEYSVIACNQQGCESAKTLLYVNYLTVYDNDTRCIAMGYPEPQLLSWQTGTNQTLLPPYFNNTIQQQEVFSSVISTLLIDDQSRCRQSRGYVCTFSNDGLLTKSTIIHCQPAPPSGVFLSYANADGTVCFEAYTHPDYPVNAYFITNNDNETYTFHTEVYNFSHLHCTSWENQSLGKCEIIELSVIAENALGNSTSNQIQVTLGDSTCQDAVQTEFYFIQILFGRVHKCNQWKLMDREEKLESISMVLSTIIREGCNCTFQRNSISQERFYCSPEDPSYVFYQARIAESSYLTHSQTSSIIEMWVKLQPSLQLQGSLLHVKAACPVVIEGFETPECKNMNEIRTAMTTWEKAAIIGSVSALVVVIVLGITTFITWKARKRHCTAKFKSSTKRTQDSKYEEVFFNSSKPEEAPVYEEIILPIRCKNEDISCTDCGAYNVNSLARGHSTANSSTTRTDSNYQYTSCVAYAVTINNSENS